MDNCSICLEKLDKDVHKLKCTHEFHTECIERSLIVTGLICPLCRGSVVDDEVKNECKSILNIIDSFEPPAPFLRIVQENRDRLLEFLDSNLPMKYYDWINETSRRIVSENPNIFSQVLEFTNDEEKMNFYYFVLGHIVNKSINGANYLEVLDAI